MISLVTLGAVAGLALPVQNPAPFNAKPAETVLVQLAPPTPGVPRNTSPRSSSRRSQPVVRPAPVPVPTPSSSAPTQSSSSQPYRERYTWFWEKISTKFDDGTPTRLATAEALTASKPENGAAVARPSGETMRALATAHKDALAKAFGEYKVSPAFLIAVMWAESAGNPKAISTAGAGGLMQLMPSTADRFGVRDRFDPAQNILGGAEYLFVLLGLMKDDPLLALAGYNAGEGRVYSYDGIPPFAETRDYVPKVIGAWAVAKTLCTTPPVKVTDGCIFK